MRSTTTTDPDWLPEDRGLLLALLAEEADTCAGCGHPIDECRDPANAGRYEVVQQICQACRVTAAQLDNDAENGNPPRGLYTGSRLT
ncbi:hypothetical protein Lfu02_79770 [Longispora fulva]|uniref:Uncharacterized protein n=1 Tax=Longispora fulva TaxID=619741 RepID=A0A8J7GXJ9_9ACTN|nr:hypothetical protein [Longispora fulva]MBG6141140.1 hypothetical protein [Longispora fulva]GIG63605.1 hypothetical protein Lfu02_79770 [Longispora fulva]